MVCRFAKVCSLYHKNGVTCTLEPGVYCGKYQSISKHHNWIEWLLLWPLFVLVALIGMLNNPIESQVQPKGVTLSSCGLDQKEEK